MSYCVNCGVELAESEKACPLCLVPVINPAKPYTPTAERNFPDVPVRGYKRGYRELLAPLAILMLIPIAVSITADVLTNYKITWSAYIVMSLILCAAYIFPPLIFKKPQLILCLTLDWICAGAFIYFISRITGGEWFEDVGFPIIMIAGALIIGLAALFTRTALPRTKKIALVLFAIALQVVCTELLINAHFGAVAEVSWSLYAFVPLVILGLFLLMLARNRRLKEHVRRRLHY